MKLTITAVADVSIEEALAFLEKKREHDKAEEEASRQRMEDSMKERASRCATGASPFTAAHTPTPNTPGGSIFDLSK